MKKNPEFTGTLPFFTICIIIQLLLLQCTPVVHPHEEAGDISIVDNKVAGFIYESCGEPASQATVVLRSADFLPEMEELAKKTADVTSPVCSTITNTDGRFEVHFPDNTSDSYCIEAVSRDGKRFLFIDSIVPDSQLLNDDNRIIIDTPDYSPVLQPPSVITGIIAPKSRVVTEGAVRVYGLDCYAAVNEDGSFILNNIPEGAFQLHITYSTTGSETGSIVDVTTETGETASLDTLRQLSYLSAEGDTLRATRQLYQSGESIPAPEPQEKEGYEFIGWAVSDDASTDIYAPGDTLFLSETTRVLYPRWKQIFYRLHLSVSGRGSASVPDSAGYGTPVTITATPDEGEEFIRWRVPDGSVSFKDSTDATTEVTLTSGDAAVEAVFSPVTFFRTYPRTAMQGTFFGEIIRPTSDGGYVFVTSTRRNSIKYPQGICLVKTDAFGDIVWTKTFTTEKDSGTCFYIPCNLIQTDDNGYIVLTRGAEKRISLFRTSPSGSLIWNKVYNYGENDLLQYELLVQTELLQADDDGYLVTITFPTPDGKPRVPILMKLNADGDTAWTKNIEPFSLIKVASRSAGGGYFVWGISTDTTSEDQSILMRTDSEGNVLWEKRILPERIDYPAQLRSTSDGGCIYTGRISTIQNNNQTWCNGKCTSGGEVTRVQQYTINIGATVRAQETADNECIFAGGEGWAGEDVHFIKTTSEGVPVWTKNITPYGDGKIARVNYVHQTADGGYVLSGLAGNGNDEPYGLYLLKTDENGDVFQNDQE